MRPKNSTVWNTVQCFTDSSADSILVTLPMPIVLFFSTHPVSLFNPCSCKHRVQWQSPHFSVGTNQHIFLTWTTKSRLPKTFTNIPYSFSYLNRHSIVSCQDIQALFPIQHHFRVRSHHHLFLFQFSLQSTLRAWDGRNI